MSLDRDLAHTRMEATLFAWWTALARSSPGARVIYLPGIAAALFPAPGEREVFNNAVTSRGTPLAASALAALAALYRDHAVGRWQLWVHEHDHQSSLRAAAAGLVVDTSTMSMGMPLDRVLTARMEEPALDLVPMPGIGEARMLLYNAERTVPQLRAAGACLYVARCEGDPATCVVSFERAGDCGIYSVETAERFRRRGLATALVRHALRRGRERGCTSASLQSTPMAESMYASIGFRPLGRYVEWQHRGDST
jgi:GNAT superfamily N-acetyltransferase